MKSDLGQERPEARPEIQAPMVQAHGVPAEAPAKAEPGPELDKLISEILTDLGEAGKAIEPLLREREDTATGLRRLEESLTGFKDQKGRLQGKLHFYITESTKLLERGQKPMDAEIRKTKIESEEVEDWIQQLETTAIPAAVENAKNARKVYAKAFSEATKGIHQKYESQMRDSILSALDLYQSWKTAFQAYQKELDMWRVDFPPEGIPNSILKFPLTTSKPSEEFLSLSLGNKKHI